MKESKRKGEGTSVAKIILIAFAVILASGVVFVGKSVYDGRSSGTKIVNELTKPSPEISALKSLNIIDSTKVSTGSQLTVVSTDGITGTKTFKLTGATETGALVTESAKNAGISVSNVAFDGTDLTFSVSTMGEQASQALASASPAVNYAVSQILNGSDFAVLNAVEKLSDGYVLGGIFSGNVKLGTYEATTTPSMSNQYFVAKLNEDGSVAWLKRGQAMSGMMRKGTDGIYAIITHGDTVAWDDFSNTADGYDVVVVKYGFDGTFQYKASLGGAGSQNLVGSFVGSDSDLNILLWSDSGYSLGGATVTSGLNIVKMENSNGNVNWTRSGIGQSSGMSRIADGGNGSVVLGYAANGMIGSQDALILKVGSNGVDEFSEQFGTTGAEHVKNVGVDASGNIYALIAGENFNGSQGQTFTSFGTPALDIQKLGDWDVYLVKLSPTGTLSWHSQIAGAGASVGYSSVMGMTSADLIVSSNGAVTVYGTFGGANVTVPTTLTKGTGDDGFVIKYDPTGIVEFAQSLDNGYDNTVSQLVSGSNGTYFGIQSTQSAPMSFSRDLIKLGSNGSLEGAESLGSFAPVTMNFAGGHVLSVINHGNGMGNPFTYQTTTFTPDGLNGATFLRVDENLDIK